MQNPVFSKEEGTWWFYDETWANEHGPFLSQTEAVAALRKYCAYLETPKEE